MDGMEMISSITGRSNLDSNHLPFVETIVHQADEPLLVGSRKPHTADV
jgi:hypothetical protein